GQPCVDGVVSDAAQTKPRAADGTVAMPTQSPRNSHTGVGEVFDPGAWRLLVRLVAEGHVDGSLARQGAAALPGRGERRRTEQALQKRDERGVGLATRTGDRDADVFAE